jgi:hypothetical protein
MAEPNQNLQKTNPNFTKQARMIAILMKKTGGGKTWERAIFRRISILQDIVS